jgi:hypothetical protein
MNPLPSIAKPLFAGLDLVAPAGPEEPEDGRRAEILSPEACGFLAGLFRAFGPRRKAILALRAERQRERRGGRLPDFLPETASIRAGAWQVPPPPADLLDRRTEVTGPVDAETAVRALTSGARCYMADLEDFTSPTWENVQHQWHPPGQQVQGGGVSRLDCKVLLLGLPLQQAQIGLGLDQRLRRQHHRLAGGGQIAAQRQPVRQPQFAPPCADHLADHHGVGRRVGHFGIEVHQCLARPVVEHRADGQAEVLRLNRRCAAGGGNHVHRQGRS